MCLSTLNLIYLLWTKPFFEKQKNKQEIISELIVYTCSHLIFLLLNSAIQQEFRDLAGWLLIGICISSIAFNLYLVIFDFLLIIYEFYFRFITFMNNRRRERSELLALERDTSERAISRKTEIL